MAKISTQIERITPARAREYLDLNYEGNRVIRQSHVENLAVMIERGQWVLTHQGIAFDEKGKLVDGQHRLQAIVRANMPVEMFVTRDMKEGSYRHIDGGTPRKTPDRIKLVEGWRHNLFACAIVKQYLKVRNGTDGKASVDDIENEFLEHTEAYAGVASLWLANVRGVTIAPVGAAIACYWTVQPKMAQEFAEALLSGASLAPHSPVLQLRQMLLTNARTHTERELYWKTIYALRHFHDRKQIPKYVAAATEDFRGNKYTTRVHQITASRKKAGESRRENRKKASGG